MTLKRFIFLKPSVGGWTTNVKRLFVICPVANSGRAGRRACSKCPLSYALGAVKTARFSIGARTKLLIDLAVELGNRGWSLDIDDLRGVITARWSKGVSKNVDRRKILLDKGRVAGAGIYAPRTSSREQVAPAASRLVHARITAGAVPYRSRSSSAITPRTRRIITISPVHTPAFVAVGPRV